MNHYVYEITNNINGKKYIGKRSCKCPIEKDKYMGSGKILNEAKKKYGIENFSKKIIYICNSEEEAYTCELNEISKVNADTNDMYYNVSFGGRGGVKGTKLSKETRLKMSLHSSNMWKDEKYRKKITESIIKLWDNEEHRKLMSIKTSKQWEDNDFRNKMSEKTKKMWADNEYRNKMLKTLAESNLKNKENNKKRITGTNAPWHKSVVCLDNLKEFSTIKQACDKYCLNHTHISSCCRGKRKTTGKKKWMYLEDYKYCIENFIDFDLYKKEKYHK